jgi:hypothetical protein
MPPTLELAAAAAQDFHIARNDEFPEEAPGPHAAPSAAASRAT